ncbi:hypothetical protein [Mesorhizobium marinum]|uniref:hypothetical protein n=1 Tax=Mesorhizobium marinum TaxID=3228790 RepID=UPI0034665748
MAALCAVAWAFGSAIRFNIAVIERDGGDRPAVEERLDAAASWTLAVAYFISVAYYLNLFGAFSVSLTPFDDRLHAKLVTSFVLLVILAVGWARGFKALERMEQVSVGIKLAVIAGLLAGLGRYFFAKAGSSDLVLHPPALTAWASVTLAFGLIVTVQGFETSRYLGASYSAATRIRSMLWAQALSALIYMTYIGFLAFALPAGPQPPNETAIISMMEIVAPVLPVLLVAAALSAQFSAAVADTSGSGGLIAELTKGMVPARMAYALLVAVGLVLTWTLDVFQIIGFASRAFALYYALQSAIAAAAAWRSRSERWRAPGYLALAVLGVVIAVFGTAFE